MSYDGWIKKKNTHTLEYFLALKKEENTVICDIDGAKGHYANRQNKTQEEKYQMISLINGI